MATKEEMMSDSALRGTQNDLFRNKQVKNHVLSVLLFASVATTTVTFSQEAEDSQTDQERPVEEESQTDTSKTEEGDSPSEPTKESPDQFDPSEEISEDYAVPFPVDI